MKKFISIIAKKTTNKNSSHYSAAIVISFVFVNLNVMLNIMSSLAQEESQSLSENIKWGKQKIFREGKVSIPYSTFLGYKQGGKYIMVIDKEQAKIVRYIYRLFLEGNSPYLISNKLNEENIPSVKNKSWGISTIISILSNEKYCGDAILQKNLQLIS